MKTSISLLTLLSASFVAAAPAPFVGQGPVVAAGTENVVIPSTNFGRREEDVVQKFGERALKLRGALLAARGGMGKDNANADAEAANAEDAAAAGNDGAQDQAAQDAAAAEDAAQGKGQGKGKNADKQAAQAGRFCNTCSPEPSLTLDSQGATSCCRCPGTAGCRCRRHDEPGSGAERD
jgi:hypothetical protein